ncbi:hypothetical protein [Streptomyces sp. RFCAC02]|uniref:hypothetical protein n=1 Tax=Streptomyces sp. RFCAC02 TaxID=2499143 RepID=UPI0019D087EA|nr:hypothetical protein [Streptomyces sp. RFCAC02]
MAEIRRSFARRAGESAFGALLVARIVLVLLVAALLLAGGARASWDTAPHAMFPGDRDSGEMTLSVCDRDVCSGPFAPTGQTVELHQTIGREAGEKLPVALRPGTDEAVVTGLPGILFAWAPLMGGLLLAAVVIAGGLRWYRTAWSLAGTALAALGVTFALWI